jgi:glycosyltransferase involved in cell wall biosynthesis
MSIELEVASPRSNARPPAADRAPAAPTPATRPIPRAVTFFAGSRDHYQLPLALAERQWLETFVTELYWPFEHRLIGSLVRRVVPPAWRSLRHQEGLPSTRVRLGWRTLAANVAMKARPGLKLFTSGDWWLGQKGRQIAAETGAAVFSYSYYVHAAFREGPDRPKLRFNFQLHPHPRSIRRILTEELDRCPWAVQSLRHEEEMRQDEARFDHLCEAPALANGWVAASEFTARTLAENGVPRERVHVVPYGVDPRQFPPRKTPRPLHGPLEVLFIGSMIQRKGLSDLLEAVRRIGPQHVRLTLAGRGFLDRQLLKHFSDVPFIMRESVEPASLVQLMHQSDVFALPSLVEGFGHVIAEAMSTGLPVLATPNTCAAELVTEGVEGWVVPIRSPEAIVERLTWAVEHRSELAAMGEAAARKARTLTWERFRNGIAAAYEQMVRSVEARS